LSAHYTPTPHAPRHYTPLHHWHCHATPCLAHTLPPYRSVRRTCRYRAHSPALHCSTAAHCPPRLDSTTGPTVPTTIHLLWLHTTAHFPGWCSTPHVCSPHALHTRCLFTTPVTFPTFVCWVPHTLHLHTTPVLVYSITFGCYHTPRLRLRLDLVPHTLLPHTTHTHVYSHSPHPAYTTPYTPFANTPFPGDSHRLPGYGWLPYVPRALRYDYPSYTHTAAGFTHCRVYLRIAPPPVASALTPPHTRLLPAVARCYAHTPATARTTAPAQRAHCSVYLCLRATHLPHRRTLFTHHHCTHGWDHCHTTARHLLPPPTTFLHHTPAAAPLVDYRLPRCPVTTTNTRFLLYVLPLAYATYTLHTPPAKTHTLSHHHRRYSPLSRTFITLYNITSPITILPHLTLM